MPWLICQNLKEADLYISLEHIKYAHGNFQLCFSLQGIRRRVV